MTFGLEVNPDKEIDKLFYSEDDKFFKENKRHLFTRTDFIIKEKYLMRKVNYPKNIIKETKYILKDKYSFFWNIYLKVLIR